MKLNLISVSKLSGTNINSLVDNHFRAAGYQVDARNIQYARRTERLAERMRGRERERMGEGRGGSERNGQ